MTIPQVCRFRFDEFRVDPRNFMILKGDANLMLEPKTFLLLVFLIENRDRLVEKRELLDAIWKDVAVTENALTREIGKLRRALGDDPKAAKYIQTVHTRCGYRFIGPVRVVEVQMEVIAEEMEAESSESTAQHGTGWLPSRRPPYRFVAALSAVALLGAGVFLLRTPAGGTKMPPGLRGVTTLAVLPFQSLGVGGGDRDVGLGMADALITRLSNSAQLAVQPVSTVLHYADPKMDSLAIGRAIASITCNWKANSRSWATACV